MSSVIGFIVVLVVVVVLFVLRALHLCWLSPLRAYNELKRNGFDGPPPCFPLGNLRDMAKKKTTSITIKTTSATNSMITHDIHSSVFPYFASWSKSYGKVFMYWLGTEPFVYIAEPEFLKQVGSGILGKGWGKPNVFKKDRKPMFGNGLVMVEGDDWVRHRHVITPAFSPANLKAMVDLMVDSTTKMLDQWSKLVASGDPEIEVENSLIATAAEIIARTSFGIDSDNGKEVFDKLREIQRMLFRSHRMVGVPYNKLMHLKQTMETRRLGKEIDSLLESIITSRKASKSGGSRQDLLGLLMADGKSNVNKFTTTELVDECKTFFFGGQETTALALTWTLLLLALHPEWQITLREEIKQVIGDDGHHLLDYNMISRLKKMGWVMNEALRLYSPAPNIQRQTREEIRVSGKTIPIGTNLWIDVVSMHHDPELWGSDVNEFKPERFKDDVNGECKHKMGFLPFGFGGRMCVGRNLSTMEYKIVLTLMLRRFSFEVSPNYSHSPTSLLSLRPGNGLPLIFQTL
ncbi:hypothetical protein Scep_006278 [Stephania cephalantha]|uniref:Cytochrome P450 n=1 Tax=Stephania cephalantha TaxID=152367 RepID=A0AAP0PNV0_9MAGN